MIRHFLPVLFPKMEIVECTGFRVTRNADFEVSDEADDLLEAVELELQRRRFGEVIRLEVAGSASSRMLTRIQQGVGAGDEETFVVQGLLDLVDVGEFVDLPRPELKYEPWAGITSPRFAAPNGSIFDEIRRGDILVHHPYTSFATSFDAFVRESARDPKVVGIKATVYRTSDDSPLVPALIEASEEGKQIGLPRRAQGALRRAPEHRVVTPPRAGGRPRRLRVLEPEDPREDDADRPPRARRAEAIRPRRHRATTTRARREATRTSVSSRPTRRSPPTSPTSSTT